MKDCICQCSHYYLIQFGHFRSCPEHDPNNVSESCLDEKIIARADHLLKTPADRLADAVSAWLKGPEKPEKEHPAVAAMKHVAGAPSLEWDARRKLMEGIETALEAYRSTRNGIGATVAQTFESPPDPVKVARLMLDSLTGGALSSLICAARDEAIPIADRESWTETSGRLKANLRALGEKIED